MFSAETMPKRGRPRKAHSLFTVKNFIEYTSDSDSDNNNVLQNVPFELESPILDIRPEESISAATPHEFHDQGQSDANEFHDRGQSNDNEFHDRGQSDANEFHDRGQSANEQGESIAEEIEDEVESIAEQIQDEGESIAEEIQDEGESIAEEIIDEGESIAEQIQDEGESIAEEIQEQRIPEERQNTADPHDEVQVELQNDHDDLPDYSDIDNEFIDDGQDYSTIFKELKSQWMQTEILHCVSKTASEAFWKLGMVYFTKLAHASRKKKIPVFRTIRDKMYNDLVPPVHLEIGYKNKESGEIEIVNDTVTPVKRYSSTKYEKLYEIGTVKVNIFHLTDFPISMLKLPSIKFFFRYPTDKLKYV